MRFLKILCYVPALFFTGVVMMVVFPIMAVFFLKEKFEIGVNAHDVLVMTLFAFLFAYVGYASSRKLILLIKKELGYAVINKPSMVDAMVDSFVVEHGQNLATALRPREPSISKKTVIIILIVLAGLWFLKFLLHSLGVYF